MVWVMAIWRWSSFMPDPPIFVIDREFGASLTFGSHLTIVNARIDSASIRLNDLLAYRNRRPFGL